MVLTGSLRFYQAYNYDYSCYPGDITGELLNLCLSLLPLECVIPFPFVSPSLFPFYKAKRI